MLKRAMVSLTVTLFTLSLAGVAFGQDKIQDHFNDASSKVKATADPVQKREVLNKSFDKMFKALNAVAGSPLISKEDKAGIEHFKLNLQEKRAELAGLNGYEKVPDAQLDAFSDYVVQDMEQAGETVSISLVALLLIILIVILIA